jgi:hypothetical protein
VRSGDVEQIARRGNHRYRQTGRSTGALLAGIVAVA